MATSKCVKCGGSTFELAAPSQPQGSNVKVCLIQCNTCGGVVGAMSTKDIHQTVKEESDKIKAAIQDLTSFIGRWADTVGRVIAGIADKVGATK